MSPIPSGFRWHYFMKHYGPCERFGIFCICVSVEIIIIIIHCLHRLNHDSYHHHCHCQHTGNSYIHRRHCHHRHNYNFPISNSQATHSLIQVYINMFKYTGKYKIHGSIYKRVLRANTNLQTEIMICEYIFKDNTKHKTYYPPIFPSIIFHKKKHHI